MLRLKNVHVKRLFWALVVVTLILTLMPAKDVPDALNFWDKLQHSLCFATLTFIGLFAYTQKPKHICVGLWLFGALIELMQAFLTTTRHGDWLDWMADSVGIIVSLVLFLIIKKNVRV